MSKCSTIPLGLKADMVFDVDIGTSKQKKFNNSYVSMQHSLHQGRIAILEEKHSTLRIAVIFVFKTKTLEMNLVLVINVGSIVEQQLSHVNIALPDSKHQSCLPILINKIK